MRLTTEVLLVQTDILPPTLENIRRAADVLLCGEVGAMPTETVYGLAGVAWDETALTKIFQVKERPTFDPLIIHVALPTAGRGRGEVDWVEHLAAARLLDAAALDRLARERVQALASQFWPGPLTLVVPKQAAVPDLATSGLPTVAIRVPQHPVAQRLLHAVAQPLAAPSANRFGRISPTSAEDVQAELAGRIAWILDGGRCTVGLESTVVGVAGDGVITLLRPGGVPTAAIEAVAKTVLQRPASATSSAAQPAPGMLSSHYAPSKPLRILPVAVAQLEPHHLAPLAAWLGDAQGVGVLLQAGEPHAAREKLQNLLGDRPLEVRSLSLGGDVEEAARELFAALRALDQSESVDRILAEPVEKPVGLAYAIADRLARASA